MLVATFDPRSTRADIQYMQSNIERIESSCFINLPLSANTMSTPRIEDDPYFKTDHTQQLIEALNLLVKHCLLRGRRLFCVVRFGKLLPFHLVNNNLIYRDPIIREFVKNWLTLDTVDRTFFLIDSEKNYEEEYQQKMQREMLQLDEALFA